MNAGTITIDHNILSFSSHSLDQLIVGSAGRLVMSEASLNIVDGPGIDFECFGNFPLGTADLNIDAGAVVQFQLNSTLSVDGFTNIGGAGTLNLGLGSNFVVDAGSNRTTFGSGITINNNTTLTWTSGNISSVDAIFFNNYGTININSASSIMGEASPVQKLNNLNTGIINVGILSGEARILGGFYNQGQINVFGGQLTVNDGITENTGRLTVHTDATFNSYSGYIQRGEVVNDGTIYNSIEMRGVNGQQNLFGNGTIQTLIVSNGTILNQNHTISGTLNLQNGKIVTGTSKLITDEGADIMGESNTNYVIGNLQRNIWTPGPVLYPVGTEAGPGFITVDDPSFTEPGSVEVRVDDNEHPNIATSGIDRNKSINPRCSFRRIELI